MFLYNISTFFGLTAAPRPCTYNYEPRKRAVLFGYLRLITSLYQNPPKHIVFATISLGLFIYNPARIIFVAAVPGSHTIRSKSFSRKKTLQETRFSRNTCAHAPSKKDFRRFVIFFLCSPLLSSCFVNSLASCHPPLLSSPLLYSYSLTSPSPHLPHLIASLQKSF